MRKFLWVPIVLAAVIASVAIGMRLGGGGSKPQVSVSQGDGSTAGPLGSFGPGSGDQGSGSGSPESDERDRRVLLPAVQFAFSPDQPESGLPVTLKDETKVDENNEILISEWKIEGPGLTIPAQMHGEEAEFTFPQEGFYRVAHRLQLKEGGLTDWVTQVVAVKQGTQQATSSSDSGESNVPPFDGTTIVDVWTDSGRIRFRINSEALGETHEGLIQGLEAKLTFANGETSTFGPGNFRMDTPLTMGMAPTRVSSLALSGTLPSGRTWEHVTHP